jgi:uncharacterized RDD family membrane protein YckC
MIEASITRRWAAFWLDCVVLGVPVYLCFLVSSSIAVFLGIALIGAYFPCFELAYGATLGKQLLSIRVTGRSTPLSPRAVFLRSLFNVFEMNPLFLGGLPAGLSILLSRNRTRIGDKIADTRVVRVGPTEPKTLPTPGGSRVILLALPAFLLFLAGLYFLKIAVPHILLQKVQAGLPLSFSFRLLVGAINFWSRYGFVMGPAFFSPFLAGALYAVSRKKEGGA